MRRAQLPPRHRARAHPGTARWGRPRPSTPPRTSAARTRSTRSTRSTSVQPPARASAAATSSAAPAATAELAGMNNTPSPSAFAPSSGCTAVAALTTIPPAVATGCAPARARRSSADGRAAPITSCRAASGSTASARHHEDVVGRRPGRAQVVQTFSRGPPVRGGHDAGVARGQPVELGGLVRPGGPRSGRLRPPAGASADLRCPGPIGRVLLDERLQTGAVSARLRRRGRQAPC